jgi:hydroxymethylbilane synthase
VVEALRVFAPHINYEVVPIKTQGDKMHESRAGIGEGKSVFTKEIEESLLRGDIHIAVHSMKDMTTDLPAQLKIAAVPLRADHRDALISRGKQKLQELPGGARVGTSSPRRRTQLLAARSDLQVTDLHGNVDTRLRKLDNGECDGIVLASAGLTRLGLEKRITEYLPTKTMLPAIGQGALAIETRTNDTEILELVSHLDEKSSHLAVDAERAFARRLGANCRTPTAAFARISEGRLTIDGMVASADGRMLLRSHLVSSSADPQRAGEELAESLLSKGAQVVLEAG